MINYSTLKHARFSGKELNHIFLTFIALTFILSFDKWGDEELNITVGLFNLAITAVFVLATLLIHIITQKIYGLSKGYHVEYTSFPLGLLIGFLITLITLGAFNYILFIGGVIIHNINSLRIGTYRFSENYKDLSKISFIGTFANLVAAVVLKLLLPLSPELIQYFIIINLLVAFFSMLPIPPQNGFNILYSPQVLHYGWMAGVTLGVCALVLYAPVLITIIGALILGIVGIITAEFGYLELRK